MPLLLCPPPDLLTGLPTGQEDWHVCTQVPANWREHAVLLLPEVQWIQYDHFALGPLWQRYLAVRAKRVKLLLWGTRDFRSPNYLHLDHLPAQWSAVWARALPMREKPPYPPLPARDILIPIEKAILSHGENTLQQHLIALLPLVREIVKQAGRTPGTSPQSQTDTHRKAQQKLEKLGVVWERALPFFQLMPHFPALYGFQALYDDMEALLDRGLVPGYNLPQAITDYLDEVLTDIIELYKLEPIER